MRGPGLFLFRWMRGWGVRCFIPVEDLGRVQLPRARMRYREGWIRIGLTTDRRCYVGTLVDREDAAIPAPTQLEANAKALIMGRAVCAFLLKYNRQYAVGEPTGRREQVIVGT